MSSFPKRSVPDIEVPEAIPKGTIILNDEHAGRLLISASTITDVGKIHPKKFFSKFKLITGNANAKIYIATAKSGETVVVKKIRLRENPLLQSYVDMELAMSMLSSNCKYVVDYYAIYQTKKNYWLIMENMEFGSLARLRTVMNFFEREIAYVMKQTLLCLQYLHRRNRIHRDLKAHNILVNAAGEIKLMDFGWATQLTIEHPVADLAVGSIFWMAPEVHARIEYGVKADIWSLGIILFELAVCEPPHYSLDPESAQLVIMMDNPPTLADRPDCVWSDLIKDFLSRCLQKNQFARFDADELLQHPFIALAYTDEEWINLLKKTFPKWPSV
eukprot:c11191_g1_i1.p1 GENE.c11191_g1_i1~~c11191_g1_i1.p1  ORF type:complete len:330 (-),score=89.98 c11191_g1_i1:167-1156(-)